MNKKEFNPPLNLEQVMSKNEGPEGYISSISLLLSDASSKLFSLHVATQANYNASILELIDDDSTEIDFPEPVFVVPSMDINDDLLTKLLKKPDLLSMYLVPQDTEYSDLDKNVRVLSYFDDKDYDFSDRIHNFYNNKYYNIKKIGETALHLFYSKNK